MASIQLPKVEWDEVVATLSTIAPHRILSNEAERLPTRMGLIQEIPKPLQTAVNFLRNGGSELF